MKKDRLAHWMAELREMKETGEPVTPRILIPMFSRILQERERLLEALRAAHSAMGSVNGGEPDDFDRVEAAIAFAEEDA